MKTRLTFIVLAVAVLVTAVVTYGLSSGITPEVKVSPNPSPVSDQRVSPNMTASDDVLVTSAIDGDTIQIDTGERVRYIGIDTPETVHPSKPVQCFGKEASAKNKELVEGKRVRLEKDVSNTDKYGRLLRYVYIDDLFVNDYLVREGYAHSSSYPPDVKYQDIFRQAEQQARENNRGLWSGCPVDSPTVATVAPYSGQCSIKGNISASGEKIYHLPGCGSYGKTRIDTGKGERYFCSEVEATTAGWRKALNCP